jgi:hypothetical protein
MTRWIAVLMCITSSLAGSHIAIAQRVLDVADLDGRVAPALAVRIRILADSATAVRLPVAPLIDKALEGASKRAPDDRIVAAVRSVLVNLRVARHSLGDSATDAELAAGVAVLRAGVSPDALAEARRKIPRRSLTVSLSVLGSLVAAGVPPSTAAKAITAQANRTDDAGMLVFGRDIERSIASGVPAYSAVAGATGGMPGPTPGKPAPRPKP